MRKMDSMILVPGTDDANGPHTGGAALMCSPAFNDLPFRRDESSLTLRFSLTDVGEYEEGRGEPLAIA